MAAAGGGLRGKSRSPIPSDRKESQLPQPPFERLPLAQEARSPNHFRQWLEKHISAAVIEQHQPFQGLGELKCIGEQSPAALFMNRMLKLATEFPIPVLAEIAEKIPQIIVTGDQSAGKSTMLEALVGFKFNVVKGDMATKRPLVIHMIPSAEHTTPLCTLSEMGVEEEVPVEDLAKTISAKQPGGPNVSSDQLTLTIRYSSFNYGQEIRIVDLPGLRASVGSAITAEQKALAEDIEKMTMQYLAARRDSIWLVMLGDGQVNNMRSPSFLKDIVEARSMHRKPIFIISKFQKRLDDFNEASGGEDMNRFFQGESDGLGTVRGLCEQCYLLEFSPQKYIYGDSYSASQNGGVEKGADSATFKDKSVAWREHCQKANQAMLQQANDKGVKKMYQGGDMEKYVFDSMKRELTTILNAEYSQRARTVHQLLLQAISVCQDMEHQIFAEKKALDSLDANTCINHQTIRLKGFIAEQWTNAGYSYNVHSKDHLAVHFFTAAQEKLQKDCDWRTCFEHPHNMSQIDGKPCGIQAANVETVFVKTSDNCAGLESPLIGAAAFLRLRKEFKIVLMNVGMWEAGNLEIDNMLASGFGGVIGSSPEPSVAARLVALNRARNLRLLLIPFIQRLRNIFARFVQHCCSEEKFPIHMQLQSWSDVTHEIRCKFLEVILSVVDEQVNLLEAKLEDCFFMNTLTLDDSLVFGAPNCAEQKFEDMPKFHAERLKESVKELSFRPRDWDPAMADDIARNKNINHNSRQYFIGIRHLLGMSINAFLLYHIDDFMMGVSTDPRCPVSAIRFHEKFETAFNTHLVVLKETISLKTKPRINQLQAQLEFLQNVVSEATKLKDFYNAEVKL